MWKCLKGKRLFCYLFCLHIYIFFFYPCTSYRRFHQFSRRTIIPVCYIIPQIASNSVWYFYIACSALKCICVRSFQSISSYWLSPWAMDRLKEQLLQLLKPADWKAPGSSLQRYGQVTEVRWILVLILKNKI